MFAHPIAWTASDPSRLHHPSEGLTSGIERARSSYHKCRAVPCRAVPCRAVPCRAVPCRAVPCRAVPCRAVPCRAVPCRAVPCRAVPCRAVPCRAVPCRAVPCRAVPCRAVPCRAVPCRAVPCRAVPCRAVPRMPPARAEVAQRVDPARYRVSRPAAHRHGPVTPCRSIPDARRRLRARRSPMRPGQLVPAPDWFRESAIRVGRPAACAAIQNCFPSCCAVS